jgi:hypothetical protein
MRINFWFQGVVLLVILLSGCAAPLTANPNSGLAAATVSPTRVSPPVVTESIANTPVPSPVMATTPVRMETQASLVTSAVNGSCEISSEEYLVYSAVIKSAFMHNNPKMIVIDDHTSLGMDDDHPPVQPEFVQAKAPDQAEELLADLESKMTRPCPLEDQFNVGVPVELLSQAESDQIFAKGTDKTWTAYYEQFPGAQGKMDLSRVGFSKDGIRAVVYAGNMQGGLAGGGYNFLLEKQNGNWVVQAQEMTWIS